MVKNKEFERNRRGNFDFSKQIFVVFLGTKKPQLFFIRPDTLLLL
jgi:hypothetical protein